MLKVYYEDYETKPIQYDFNEGVLYGVSGQPIKRLASKFKSWNSVKTNLEYELM